MLGPLGIVPALRGRSGFRPLQRATPGMASFFRRHTDVPLEKPPICREAQGTAEGGAITGCVSLDYTREVIRASRRGTSAHYEVHRKQPSLDRCPARPCLAGRKP